MEYYKLFIESLEVEELKNLDTYFNDINSIKNIEKIEFESLIIRK